MSRSNFRYGIQGFSPSADPEEENPDGGAYLETYSELVAEYRKMVSEGFTRIETYKMDRPNVEFIDLGEFNS